jgi:hypothetical protein
LPIINKPKHPKKGEYKEKNGKTHVQQDEKNHLRRGMECQVFKPPLVVKNVTNNKRGGPFKTMPSLKKPSPTTIARLK